MNKKINTYLITLLCITSFTVNAQERDLTKSVPKIKNGSSLSQYIVFSDTKRTLARDLELKIIYNQQLEADLNKENITRKDSLDKLEHEKAMTLLRVAIKKSKAEEMGFIEIKQRLEDFSTKLFQREKALIEREKKSSTILLENKKLIEEILVLTHANEKLLMIKATYSKNSTNNNMQQSTSAVQMVETPHINVKPRLLYTNGEGGMIEVNGDRVKVKNGDFINGYYVSSVTKLSIILIDKKTKKILTLN